MEDLPGEVSVEVQEQIQQSNGSLPSEIKKSPEVCVSTPRDISNSDDNQSRMVKGPNPVCNLNDLSLYLKTISRTSSADSIFTYAWLDTASKSALKGYGVRFGTFGEMVKEYSALQSVGGLYVNPTLHIVLNETKLTGRRTEDVECPRVLCLDLDQKTPKKDITAIIEATKPNIVIETSPEKYHIYWKISYLVPLLKWSLYQLGLASLYHGDTELHILNHTCRAPGFPRTTKEGAMFVPRVVYRDPLAPTLSEAEIESKWSSILEVGKKADAEIQSKRKKLRTKIKAGDIKTAAKLASSGGRNSTLFSYVFEKVRGYSEKVDVEVAFELGNALNEEFKTNGAGALAEDEVKKTARSAWERGCERWEQKEEHHQKLKSENKKLEENYTSKTSVSTDIPTASGDSAGNNGDGGGQGGGFKYDFTGPLMTNRVSENSVAGRVTQKYANSILKIGRSLYAYNYLAATWEPQRRHQEILAKYIDDCVVDLTKDEVYLDKCRDSEGAFSAAIKDKKDTTWFKPNTTRNILWRVLQYDAFPSATMSVFDGAADLLYCKNGVVNLIDGTIRSATPEDLLLQKTDINFDEKAECPDWCQFLSEVFSENEDPDSMVEFMQKVFGYTLTGSIDAQLLFIHYGENCNGKSKVLLALSKLMGSYATKLAGNTLAKTENAVQKEFNRIGAKLEGKRLVVIDDLDTKTQWSEGYVKLLTGPEIVAARLYEDERDIPNRAKFHLACNIAPAPESNNMAILRRMCLIPYNRQFKQDPNKENWICSMIERELPGILNWAVKGRQKLYADKQFNFPTEVLMTIEDYKTEHFTEENVILNKVKTLCELPQSHEADLHEHTVTEVYDHFTNALKAGGMTLNKFTLGRFLKSLGFTQIRKRIDGSVTRLYKIKLISPEASKFD